MQNSQAGTPTSGACGGTNPASAKAIALLQQSLTKNPAYGDVREAIALLQTCGGNGAQAEQLISQGLKGTALKAVSMVVVDAALLYARGNSADALQLLLNNTPPKGSDGGYAELLADLEAASK